MRFIESVAFLGRRDVHTTNRALPSIEDVHPASATRSSMERGYDITEEQVPDQIAASTQDAQPEAVLASSVSQTPGLTNHKVNPELRAPTPSATPYVDTFVASLTAPEGSTLQQLANIALASVVDSTIISSEERATRAVTARRRLLVRAASDFSRSSHQHDVPRSDVLLEAQQRGVVSAAERFLRESPTLLTEPLPVLLRSRRVLVGAK